MRSVTLQGFVDALYELTGDELRRVHRAALKSYALDVRQIAVERLATRGVARRLWGGASPHARGGARKMVLVSAVRRSADEDHVSIWALGLAAMMEVGGRTAPHIIRPTRKEALKFPDGGFVQGWEAPETAQSGKRRRRDERKRRGVQHPGGAVPAQPWLMPTIEATEGLLVAKINAGSKSVIGRLFGG